MTEYPIKPVTKPRMTQRDKWLKPARKCVATYWAYKEEVLLRGVSLPVYGYHVIFIMPMPKSWSKKKRADMDGGPHQVRPDKDNLEKALLDAIFKEDSIVWDGRVTKLWGYEGKIIVDEC